MRFQRATQKHLDAIMNITNEAKAQLKRMEIDQWQKGYPSKEVWEEDLKQERAYIALDESTDAVMGAFSFFTSQDPSYKQIDGAWLTGDSIEDGSYASLQSGKRVVITKANLLNRHRVVFVNNRNNLKIKQAFKGISSMKVRISVCGAVARYKNT